MVPHLPGVPHLHANRPLMRLLKRRKEVLVEIFRDFYLNKFYSIFVRFWVISLATGE